MGGGWNPSNGFEVRADGGSDDVCWEESGAA
jgi:hypothetical protein